MSESLCQIKKTGGGGSMSETSLWTNNEPTSNFAAQTVTISDDIDNYSYIGIEYEFSTAVTTLTNKVFFPVDLFKTYRFNGNTQHAFGAFGMQNSTSNLMYARVAYYVSDTSVGFSSGYGINRAYENAASMVPLKIIGLK